MWLFPPLVTQESQSYYLSITSLDRPKWHYPVWITQFTIRLGFEWILIVSETKIILSGQGLQRWMVVCSLKIISQLVKIFLKCALSKYFGQCPLIGLRWLLELDNTLSISFLLCASKMFSQNIYFHISTSCRSYHHKISNIMMIKQLDHFLPMNVHLRG